MEDQIKDSERVCVTNLVSYVLTCRKTNQPGWMKHLAKYINLYLESAEDSDRFKFNGEGFERVVDK